MREHDDIPRRRRRCFNGDSTYARTGRLTEHERARLAELCEHADADPVVAGGGDRYSTWDAGDRGPRPYPEWVVTDLAAVGTELGVLKTGKEADVHLLRRGLPGARGNACSPRSGTASSEHRHFQRDSGYLEGRRMRRSRETRAMSNRSSFGRNLIAEQWAVAEFAALSRLWTVGDPMPYPVQRVRAEILLEFLGDDDGNAAPRLAQLRPDLDELDWLWCQAVTAVELLAGQGLAHGGLSAYNVLVHDGRLMLIDLPQVVDVFANLGGPEYLARDVRNLATWFTSRGLDIDVPEMMEHVRERAGLR